MATVEQSRGADKRTLIKLAVVAVLMFVFGIVLLPAFYKQICEVTGIRELAQADNSVNTQVDAKRDVIVQFDANVRSELPWRFKPEQTQITVHPGQLNTVIYDVENVADRTIVGQAVPSFGPSVAGQYFRKLECFCFTRQTFQAHEKRRMPVVFYVDAGLPHEVGTITLSYSFFEVAGAS